MEIKVLSEVEVPSEESIEKFEIDNNIVLPELLKNFWLKINPIYIQQNVFSFGEKKYYIDRFYPFSDSYELSFQFIYRNFREYFENGYVAFANDPGDWQYVISLEKDSCGFVYLCRMDDVPPNSLERISINFEEFINGLKSEDEV